MTFGCHPICHFPYACDAVHFTRKKKTNINCTIAFLISLSFFLNQYFNQNPRVQMELRWNTENRYPWRHDVDDVISFHFVRLKDHRWPTSQHSKTQRDASFIAFPKRLWRHCGLYKETPPLGSYTHRHPPHQPLHPAILIGDSPGRL